MDIAKVFGEPVEEVFELVDDKDDSNINIDGYVFIVDVCDGAIEDTALSESIKRIKDWKEICKQCEYHNN